MLEYFGEDPIFLQKLLPLCPFSFFLQSIFLRKLSGEIESAIFKLMFDVTKNLQKWMKEYKKLPNKPYQPVGPLMR